MFSVIALGGVTAQAKPAVSVHEQPNMDGLVEVSFKIDATGIIQIVHIDSTSPQLTEYVVNKLGKIKLTNETKSDGRVITYRFMFKKQA
jgi:hypothetical protein